MKRLIFIILVFASIGASAQSWLNFGSNGVQRKINGTDTLYRWNGGASGYLYGYSLWKYSQLFSGGGSSYTFSDGLNESAGVVKLGGTYASGISLASADGKNVLQFRNAAGSSNKFTIALVSPSGSKIVTHSDQVNDTQAIAGFAVNDGAFSAGFGATTLLGPYILDNLFNSGLKASGRYEANYTGYNYTSKFYVDSLVTASGGGGGGTPANPTASIGLTTINGVATTYMRSDAAPKIDSTAIRTVSNSFTKAQTNTQIDNKIAAYTPASQVQNSLSPGSTTLAPSVTATNNALALKQNALSGLGFVRSNLSGVISYDNTEYVPIARNVFGANGLSGGGNLNSDAVIVPDTSILRTVANSYSLAGLQSKLNNYATTANAVPNTRTVSAGNGLSGGGNLSTNIVLTADTGTLATKANTKTLAQLQTAFNTKQATLVSGTNIKTINGSSVLGSGDLVVGGAVSSLTTNNSSGAATLTSGVLNIPNYVAVDFYPETSEFEGAGTSGDKFRLKAAGVSVAKGGTGVGTLTGIVKGNGTSAFTAATAGTDYLTPTGSAAGLTSFPTLNQNTTGSAASLTTSRNLWGVAFNGTANITGKPVYTASATGAASINIPHGTAPTSPVNGDVWTTSAGGLFARINGVTQNYLSGIVPAANGGAGTINGILKANGSGTVSQAVSGTDYVIPSGSITGNAATATQLATSRTIGTTGITSTAASFDGSANVNIAVTAVPGSIITGNISGKSSGTTLQDVITAGNTVTTGAVSWGTGTYRAGTIYNSSDDGTVIASKTGNDGDLTLTNGTGQTAAFIPTGSTDFAVVGNISASNFTAGVYTPTYTGVSNIASFTASQVTYTVVGSIVTVYGKVDVVSSSTASTNTFRISLPIASNFTNGIDANGVFNYTTVSANGVFSGVLDADTTNDAIFAAFYPNTTNSNSVRFSFQYRIK